MPWNGATHLSDCPWLRLMAACICSRRFFKSYSRSLRLFFSGSDLSAGRQGTWHVWQGGARVECKAKDGGQMPSSALHRSLRNTRSSMQVSCDVWHACSMSHACTHTFPCSIGGHSNKLRSIMCVHNHNQHLPSKLRACPGEFIHTHRPPASGPSSSRTSLSS